MFHPSRRALLATLAFAASVSAASADPVECVYDSWRGAETNSVAESWVGIGFIADTAQGTVQVKLADGLYPEEQAQLVQQANFTGLVYYKSEKASDGSVFRLRYSFRIYTGGKCEGRMDQDGYAALVGSGRVK